MQLCLSWLFTGEPEHVAVLRAYLEKEEASSTVFANDAPSFRWVENASRGSTIGYPGSATPAASASFAARELKRP